SDSGGGRDAVYGGGRGAAGGRAVRPVRVGGRSETGGGPGGGEEGGRGVVGGIGQSPRAGDDRGGAEGGGRPLLQAVRRHRSPRPGAGRSEPRRPGGRRIAGPDHRGDPGGRRV